MIVRIKQIAAISLPAALLIGGLLFFWLVTGVPEFAALLLIYLFYACAITFAINLIIMIPLSFVRRTRHHLSVFFMLSSYVYGATLWLWSISLVNHLWGAFITAIGTIIMFIAPLAMLAALLNGLWSPLIQLIILAFLAFACRVLPLSLLNKSY